MAPLKSLLRPPPETSKHFSFPYPFRNAREKLTSYPLYAPALLNISFHFKPLKNVRIFMTSIVQSLTRNQRVNWTLPLKPSYPKNVWMTHQTTKLRSKNWKTGENSNSTKKLLQFWWKWARCCPLLQWRMWEKRKIEMINQKLWIWPWNKSNFEKPNDSSEINMWEKYLRYVWNESRAIKSPKNFGNSILLLPFLTYVWIFFAALDVKQAARIKKRNRILGKVLRTTEVENCSEWLSFLCDCQTKEFRYDWPRKQQ